MNRTQQPAFTDIDSIRLPSLEEARFDNGLTLYQVQVTGSGVLRIEFLFEAGNVYQGKNLVAPTVGSLLLSGTHKRSEKEIAEIVDYYGAFIDLGIDHDNSWLVLYTMNKYLVESLEIVKDVLVNANFPESILSTYLTKRKQAFNIEIQKVKTLARRKFSEVLFGSGHPYGRLPVENDFDNVKKEDLHSFYRGFYHPSRCKVFVSGDIESNFRDIFASEFGQNDWNKGSVDFHPEFKISHLSDRYHLEQKEDAVQSAVRIGGFAVPRSHPDFTGLLVLNTVLGGYFGSRLMKNIREEKGYTYGIGSAIVSYKHADVFVIAAEMGNEYCKPAIEEVYKEIEILRTASVPGDELMLVKNFLLGDMMRSADGPFQVVDIWKSIIEFNLGEDYLSRMIREIKAIQEEDIKIAANKYLRKENLIEVIAGKIE